MESMSSPGTAQAPSAFSPKNSVISNVYGESGAKTSYKQNVKKDKIRPPLPKIKP